MEVLGDPALLDTSNAGGRRASCCKPRKTGVLGRCSVDCFCGSPPVRPVVCGRELHTCTALLPILVNCLVVLLLQFYRVEVRVVAPETGGASKCRSVLRRFSHFSRLHSRVSSDTCHCTNLVSKNLQEGPSGSHSSSMGIQPFSCDNASKPMAMYLAICSRPTYAQSTI